MYIEISSECGRDGLEGSDYISNPYTVVLASRVVVDSLLAFIK